MNQGESTAHPTTISLIVNGQNLPFEVDTGAVHTVINMNVWYKLGSPFLRPSKLKLKSYGRTTLQIKGECTINVEYGQEIFNLSIVVIYGPGPALVGLQWIKILQLDLNSLVHG
jgi:predicted aspartyl protease